MNANVDFGWWQIVGGRRALLTWWADIGRLILEGPFTFEVYPPVFTLEEARQVLQGWEEHCDEPRGLEWARSRIAGHTSELGLPGVCPACHRPEAS